jgi:hypothetical protein
MSEEQVEVLSQDELETLKARADRMGITYHPSIGVDKLREKVRAAMSDDPKPSAPEVKAPHVAQAPVQETVAQERARLKREATALVRIRLSCMNPAKKEWTGEIFTVGNSIIGSLTKFVPFNADEGWHVPKILLDVLQERKCQVFTTLKSKNGIAVRQGKLIKEFAIEILDPLTEAEIHDLAQRQAMAGSVD